VSSQTEAKVLFSFLLVVPALVAIYVAKTWK